MSQKQHRALIVGGNGFVGQHVMALLAQQGWQLGCISRSGDKPKHLQGADFAWTESVEWLRADGTELLEQDITGYSALVCLVGAPPVPTLTQKAIATQRKLNAAANLNVIRLARTTSVERLVLVGAHIPRGLRSPIAGYFLGKRDCYREARRFAEIPGKSACVIQPPLIVGDRFTRNGLRIPLHKILKPLQGLPFTTVMPVETIAQVIVNFVTTSSSQAATDAFQVIGPAQLAQLTNQ